MTKAKFSWLYCLMAVLSLSFVLTSCDKDDDDDEKGSDVTLNSLVGVWQGITYNEYCDGELVEEDNDQDQYYQFNQDGTFIDAFNENGHWYISKGTWKLTDNDLVLDYLDEEDDEWTIKSLNSSKLVWTTENKYDDEVWSYVEDFNKISALPDGAISALSNSKDDEVSDKDDDADSYSPIVGVWQSQYYVEYINGEKKNEFDEDYNYFEFNDDGSFIDVYKDKGNWVVEKGRWDNVGNTLLLRYKSGDSENAKIKLVNSSELILYSEDIDGFSYEANYKKVSALPEGAL